MISRLLACAGFAVASVIVGEAFWLKNCVVFYTKKLLVSKVICE